MPALTNTDQVDSSDRQIVGPKPDESHPDGGDSPTGIIPGDVFGPGSSTAGDVAVFANATGKLIADGGYPAAFRFDTMGNLRALGAAPTINGTFCIVDGFGNPGDGGGGAFYWDAASTEADDGGVNGGGTIVKQTAVATGRWKRIGAGIWYNTYNQRTLDVRWYGAIPDYATDAAQGVEDAYAALPNGGCLYFPGGNYLFNTAIDINGAAAKGVAFQGDGVDATNWIYNNAAGNLLSIQEAAAMLDVSIRDIGMVSLIGGGPTAYVALFIAVPGGTLRLENVTMSEFPNVIAIKVIKCTSVLRNLTTGTSTGSCQFWQEGGRIDANGFFLSAPQNPSASTLPCLVIRCDGGVGASMTSASLTNGYVQGAGIWTEYDGGTAYVTAVIEGYYGTLNEGRVTDILFDAPGNGNAAGSIALLINNQNADTVIANWILADLWLNAGRKGIKIKGVDATSGGKKTCKGFTITNCITRPNGEAGIDLDATYSVNISALATFAVGANSIGVKISNGGSNDSKDFTIAGMTSSLADTAALTGVEVNGTKVKNVTAFMTTEGATNPYSLTGGANKATQSLVFNWPDGAGGMNCSGALHQNV